jgi:hypothetical protein
MVAICIRRKWREAPKAQDVKQVSLGAFLERKK